MTAFTVARGVTARWVLKMMAKQTVAATGFAAAIALGGALLFGYPLNRTLADTNVTIVGGGIHGTHLAIRLLNAGVGRGQLQRTIESGRINLCRTEITATTAAGGTVVASCRDGTAHCLDRVVCATGFGSPYEGPLFDQLRTETALAAGYRNAPVLSDETLRWRREDGTLSRIAVSGAAAQQVLGPFSRNIIGARRAGDCVVGWLQRSERKPSRKHVQTDQRDC